MRISYEILLSLVINEPDEILAKAEEVRERAYGNRVSVSKSVFLPLTKQCRNRCSYCGFRSNAVNTWMTPQKIRNTLEKGKETNVGEALFTMGEQPEKKYATAKKFLEEHMFQSTVEYTKFANKIALTEYQILPHSNLGILTEDEFIKLKEWNASMGIMLESSSERLLTKGMPHEHAPSKAPNVRKQTIKLAGKLKIPFTSGILVGIGENLKERLVSLFDLAEMHKKYGHLQEIIIQNFQPLPNTPMANTIPLGEKEFLQTVAIARLILPEKVAIQVPPNLNHRRIIDTIKAGANDLGGVSPVTIDYINYTSSWPEIAQLSETLTKHDFTLVERLPVYPEFIKWTSSQIREIIGERYYYDYRNLNE